MRVSRQTLLAAVLTVAGIGFASSEAKAQYVTRPVPAYRGQVPAYAAPRSVYVRPTVRRYQYGNAVYPHAPVHRDWTTGNENLPLAKPWLHRFR